MVTSQQLAMGNTWQLFIGALVLLLVLVQDCCGLYEDQVGMYDWHQQYIGRVKLAEFQTSGQRKRVYVATEQNVVAALNLRTGEIAWRHALGANEPIEALHVYPKYLVALSGGGKMLRAWSLVDGVLVWDATILPPSEPSPDAAVSFHVMPSTSDVGPPPDIILLSGGGVYRISASNGAMLWQTAALATKLYVTESVIYAVSFTNPTADTALGLAVTRIDATTGTVGEMASALAPVALSTTTMLLTDGAMVVLDFEGTRVYVGQIEGQPLKLVETEVGTLVKEGAAGAAALLPARLRGAFGLAAKGSVAVIKVNSDGSLQTLTELQRPAALSDKIPMDGEKTVVGVVHHEKGQDIVLKVMSNDGTEEEGSRARMTLAPHRGVVQRVYVNAYARKGGSHGFRLLVVGEDDSLSLLQQGEVVWVREEALASVVAVKMVDLPRGRDGAASVEHSLLDWFKAQWLRAKATVMLATPEEQALVQYMRLNSASKNAPTRDHNGFRKLIVVLTQSGKILALHTGDGRIIWSTLLESLRADFGPAGISDVETSGKPVGLQLLISQDPHRQLADKAPQLVVVGKAGPGGGDPGILTHVNGHTGQELGSNSLSFPISLTVQLPVSDASGHRLLLLVDNSPQPAAHIFPANQEALEVFQQHASQVYFYLVDEERGSITGYSIAGQKENSAAATDQSQGHVFGTTEIWKIVFPTDMEAIAAVAARRSDESAHTQTKARARNVVYKYLNKNTIFVATAAPPKAASLGPVTPEEAWLVAYVLDSVTGRILHRVTHPGAQGPVHAVMSENWVVYHYFNLRSHRYEMSVLELYDESETASAGDIAKYAFGLGGGSLSAPLSSWALPPVKAQAQSYFFSYSLKAMTVTATSMGITNKQLLLATIGDQVLAMDKRFLDPRRSLTPSQQDKEEGIMPYTDALPITTQSYLTHGLQVEGLRGVATEASTLESTTHVFAYGIDLFYIRHAPSRLFDTLSEDFGYVLLLVTIAALVVSIGVTGFLTERKELQLRWR